MFLYQLKNLSQPEQARLRTIAFKYDNSMLGLRYLQAPNRWTRRRPEIKLQELRKISFHQFESDIELLIPLQCDYIIVRGRGSLSPDSNFARPYARVVQR